MTDVVRKMVLVHQANCKSTVKISTNDRCGKEDGTCPSGKCCSKYGWCGTSERHCKVNQGCQIAFGECH